MSILDANADELQQAAVNSFRPPAAPEAPGAFSNFGPSAGNFFMRSMATAGRSLSMAAAAVPVAIDSVTSPDSVLGRALGDKSLSDRYFAMHDQVFGDAVDHWTPKPQEVGAAGQIVGELAGGMVKFLASPALAVADAQLSTGEDLVRQGVGAGTAQAAGGIAGLSAAVGIRAPAAVGSTLAARIASGAGLNVAQSAVATGAENLVLRAGGAPADVVAQFNPLDVRARGVDALMGMVFGAKYHHDFTQAQRDALTVLRQGQHLEDSLPGRPATAADATAAATGTRQAIGQLLRGEPVLGDEPLPNFVPDPAADEFRAHMAEAVQAEVPKPLEPPAMTEPHAPPEPDPAAAPAQGAKAAEPAEPPPRFPESLRLPTGDFDATTGEPRTISANEHVARAEEAAQTAERNAPNLFQTAASCLMGSL